MSSDKTPLKVPVNILVEGMTDEPVAKRLLMHVGFAIGDVFGRSGKADLLLRLPNYNQAAHSRFAPWFVLVDLDNDKHVACAPQALKIWLLQPGEGMRLRVAVRAIEAWILADTEQLANFLSGAPTRIPIEPEKEIDPKQSLVNAARFSTSRSIREGFVQRQGSGGRVGPRYADLLNTFVENSWRPDEAAKRSESLQKCIRSLRTLKIGEEEG